MTLGEARLIKYLYCEGRILHSLRRIAEIYYRPDEDGHGNQLYGEELVREALEVLNENREDWDELQRLR